jgi:hypothetical protein
VCDGVCDGVLIVCDGVVECMCLMLVLLSVCVFDVGVECGGVMMMWWCDDGVMMMWWCDDDVAV